MTISDPPPPPRETQRLDAFVDAAFAAGFALIAVFWLGHRRFGQIAPYLPGFAYWLITVGLGVAAWLDGRRTRAAAVQ
ncbi:hypothetical protein [Brevundimonas balnearis]|uniref:Uncharacterized protein n=1 Tax=Brevundimonas balnearis TaxID=1572858 RepID=A0ABV6R390_9CAUL